MQNKSAGRKRGMLNKTILLQTSSRQQHRSQGEAKKDFERKKDMR
jgi:hypothetical protein